MTSLHPGARALPAGREPTEPPRAAISADRVEVMVRSADREIVRVATRMPAQGRLEPWASACFEVGAQALLAATRDTDTGAVLRAADTAAARVEAAAAAAREGIAAGVTAATGEDGALAAGVARALGDLRTGIAEVVDRARGTAAAAAAEALRQAADASATTTRQLLAGHEAGLRALASADHPAWMAVAAQVKDSQAETRAQLASLLARVEASDAAAVVGRGTATKGAGTERTVADVLSGIALGHGDLPEAVGTGVGSVGGRRVGDWVATLLSPAARGRDVRVVVEVKDGTVSLPALARELDVALANRRGNCAMGVVRTECLPGGRRLVVLGERRIAIAWQPGDSLDLLSACYATSRLIAVWHSNATSGDERAALPGLRVHVAEALAALGHLDALDRAAGQAGKHVREIEAVSTRIRHAVGAALSAATRLLDAA